MPAYGMFPVSKPISNQYSSGKIYFWYAVVQLRYLEKRLDTGVSPPLFQYDEIKTNLTIQSTAGEKPP